MSRTYGANAVWGYSKKNSVRRLGAIAFGANLHPFAEEMAAWLRQQGRFGYSTEQHKQMLGAYTNPYTYSGSAIVTIFATVVDDILSFLHGDRDFPAADLADVHRVRLMSELYLFQSRFLEVACKQMLFCTDFDPELYADATLGQMPSKGQKGKSSISLLGSLANRFELRDLFDVDVFPILDRINSTRRSYAAHADSLPLNVRTVDESRSHLDREHKAVLDSFSDLLLPLAKVERGMIDEIESKFGPGPALFGEWDPARR